MRNKNSTRHLARKFKYSLKGGPFNGHSIYMSCGGTFRFSVGGWHGYYTSDGIWINGK